MIEHYNYIMNIKRKELSDILNDVAYRTQELEQLETMYKQKLTTIVAHDDIVDEE